VEKNSELLIMPANSRWDLIRGVLRVKEANEIFDVYNKREIRKELETEYHVEKKKRTEYKWKSAEWHAGNSRLARLP